MIAPLAVVLLSLAILTLFLISAQSVTRLIARAVDPPPRAAVARWHRPAGYVLVAIGVALWTATAAVLEPTTAGVFADMLAVDPLDRAHPAETARLAMFGREARWGAILLGVGGLVLLARAHRRRRAVAAGVVAWVGIDLALDSAAVAGPGVVLAGALVGGGLFALSGRRAAHTAPAGLLSLVYSGVSVTASMPLVIAVGPWMAEQLPSWAVAMAAAQAALLVAAGVAVALAAAPAATRRTAGDALTVGILGAAAAAAHAVWEFSAGDDSFDGRAFLPSVAAVVLVLVLCARACARPHPAAWWVWPVAAVPLTVLAVALIAGAWGVLAVMQFIADASLRETAFFGLFLEGPVYVLPGIVAGAFLGLLSLLPVAWSYRRQVALAVDESTGAPAPVALPGVAEVLEWAPKQPTSSQLVAAEPVAGGDVVLDLDAPTSP